ncbi:glutathione S-transferase [Alteromonas sp. 5E99-2]|nr:glutathione S-transferase [Alteromonas sp. 5E99-2]
MTFYDTKGLPNPDRIRIAFKEKGVFDQIKVVQVNLWEGEHRTEGFRKINPNATVPLIVLKDGTAISESTAITEYIDHQFEGVNLTGRSAEQRAVIHMMQRRGEQKIVDAIGAYFHHATIGFGPEVEGKQNKEWGQLHYEKTLQGMRYFNDVLKSNKYIAGDIFSMADITVFTGLNFSETFPKVMIPKDCNALLEWRNRMFERPSCIDSKEQMNLV